MMAMVRVMRRDELWTGEKVGVRVGRTDVLLVDIDGEVRAWEDRCRHQAVPLSEGRLEGRTLICRAHAWCYDALSGRGLNPEGMGLRAFPVEIRDGEIWVDAGEPS
jgi:toluene monooxygenase system ferredoxin subunit